MGAKSFAVGVNERLHMSKEGKLEWTFLYRISIEDSSINSCLAQYRYKLNIDIVRYMCILFTDMCIYSD